jgi:hypothetical protein
MARRRGLWTGLGSGVVCGILAVGISVAPARADERFDGGDSHLTAAAVLDQRIAAGDLEYRDPSTGEIVVATEDRIDALRADLERYFGQPPVLNEQVSADGTVMSVIGDAIRDVQLVRINLDGTRTTACMRSLDAAVAFIVGVDSAGNEAADSRPSAVDR